MKKIYWFLFAIVLSSCSVKQKPEFIKIDDIRLLSTQLDTVKLGVNAYFKNPNTVSGKIQVEDMRVAFNKEQVALVSSEEFKVPAKSEFTIPLQVAIPTSKIFKNSNKGILAGLINSIFTKTIEVHIKGDLRYKMYAFSKVYHIDKTEKITIQN